jgi:hypothetical protein
MAKVTNMVIKSNEAKLSVGSTTKAKLATEAVEAVTGVRAKKAVSDKEGKVTSPAVEAVAAVKAVAASPEVAATQTMFLHGTTEEIMDEVQARVKANGFDIEDTECPEETDYGFKLKYRIQLSDHGAFRAAFKKAKMEDNEPGKAIQKVADDKVKAEEKELAKKEAEAKKAQDAKDDENLPGAQKKK